MKAKDRRTELAAMSVEQLKAKLSETRQEVFNLRFKHATGQLEKVADLPAAKREVARVLTYLTKKEA